MTALLRASDLAIEIDGQELVSSVDLVVGEGEAVGIVGETGSGKSLTCRAFAGTLAGLGGRVSRGELSLGGRDIASLRPADWGPLYGRVVSLIPQNSLSALNPLMRVEGHLTETIKVLGTADGEDPRRRALDLVERVGLRDPELVLRQYPHQLSGGMRQRVMIALALAGKPDLLVADEPTTALDVTVQRDILRLLVRLVQDERMALVLVSHDLGVVGAATNTVAVMYAGRVVERGPTHEVLRSPRHPYTKALLAARPTIGAHGRLQGIPGSPATPDRWPAGCRFAPRCPFATDVCRDAPPGLEAIGPDALVACYRARELVPDASKTGGP